MYNNLMVVLTAACTTLTTMISMRTSIVNHKNLIVCVSMCYLMSDLSVKIMTRKSGRNILECKGKELFCCY